jgi:hypothetical protein
MSVNGKRRGRGTLGDDRLNMEHGSPDRRQVVSPAPNGRDRRVANEIVISLRHVLGGLRSGNQTRVHRIHRRYCCSDGLGAAR